jgi:hypothetical protein
VATIAPDYTTDGSGVQGPDAHSLVASAYRKTGAPNAPGALQPGDLITMMSEDMNSTIVPLVLAAQEEFFVKNYDQQVVANQYEYTIPARAAFASWRDVVFVDAMGNEINMTNLSPEYLKLTYPAGGNPPLYVFGFVMQNDKIILYPPNGGTPTQYQLRQKAMRKPNDLISTDSAGQITLINTGTGEVTVGNAPTEWTTSLTFDIIPNAPQFTSRGDDAAISAINTTTKILTFSDLDLVADMEVGDWVCPAGLSPIPQIPYGMFPLLAQRGAIRVLEAMGDSQNLQVAERRYQDMAVDFARTVSPRVEGTPKKIVNRNTPSWWGAGGATWSR